MLDLIEYILDMNRCYIIRELRIFFRENLKVLIDSKSSLSLGLNRSLVFAGILVAAMILDLFDAQAVTFLIAIIWLLNHLIITNIEKN